MRLAVAALGAIAAALLESTFLPALRIGGPHPDLVLASAIAWTLFVGLDGGLTWAFVGGLMLDVLAGRPLGSTAFALLVCAGLAALAGRIVEPARWIGPAVATFLLALVYAVLLMVIERVLRGPFPTDGLATTIVGRAALDAVIGGVLGAVAVWLRGRRGPARDWLGR